ncbi:DNA helicase [Tanacetum coccineum]
MEVIASCVFESELWPHFKVFTLKENMRLARPNISANERNLINSFASWLLNVGDGKIGQPNQQDPENTSWIDIPLNYCLLDNKEGKSLLLGGDFRQMLLVQKGASKMEVMASCVSQSELWPHFKGETTTYLSYDEATPVEHDRAETELLYPVEDVNTLKFPGFPPPRLELKVGALVMLLRNVNCIWLTMQWHNDDS